MPADQAQQFDVIGVRGVLGFFFEALEQFDGQTWISKVCNTFQSNQDVETYAGLGMVPQLREWIGPKNAKSLQEFSVKISNKDFEATLIVKNKDRRRDKTGQLKARIGELAQRAIAHDAVLLSALIDGGQSTTVALPGGGSQTIQCFDGLSLFSASHKIGATAINNLLAINLSTLGLGTSVGVGSPTNPSPAAVASVVLQMLTQLYGFQDDQGQPVNEFAREFILMVPIGLSGAAVQAVKGQFLALGYSNPLLAAIAPSMGDINITVVPNPRLTSHNDTMYLIRTDGVFKPLIRQVEMLSPDSANETSSGEQDGMSVGSGLIMKVLAEGSDFEFDNNAAKFSIEKSGMVGLGRFDQVVAAQMTQTAQ